jgi:transposase
MSAERLALRRARRYTLPYWQVVRAKLVLMAAGGVAKTEIAQRLGTSPQVVHRWLERFAEEGIDGLADRGRSGRPRVFGARWSPR